MNDLEVFEERRRLHDQEVGSFFRSLSLSHPELQLPGDEAGNGPSELPGGRPCEAPVAVESRVAGIRWHTTGERAARERAAKHGTHGP